MTRSERTSRLAVPLRVLVSVGLLSALALWLDPAVVIERIRGMNPSWLAAALAIGTLQFMLSAERWRRTAARLQVPLGRREAVTSYYVAAFANQVLPGGVIGDAGRAWWHSRASGQRGPAVRAVVLERASGQIALIVALLAVLVATPTGGRLLAAVELPANWGLKPTALALAAVAAVAALAAALVVRYRDQVPAWLRALGRDACRALLARRAWPAQLALSLAVLTTYCVMFACAGRMIGSDVPATVLASLAPIVLLAMLLPISIGGWGVRETAAAGVWLALGLPAAEGVAISVTYGALCLLASSPGALIGLRLSIRQRGATQPRGRRRPIFTPEGP